MSDSQSAIDLVTRFCEAWSTFDLDAIAAFFTDDAVYHNMPIAPVTGREAIKATIASFTGNVESLEFRVLNIAATGPTVLTERIDIFRFPNGTIELPVMGTFEVDGDRISAWRDYFDLNQFMNQMPTG